MRWRQHCPPAFLCHSCLLLQGWFVVANSVTHLRQLTTNQPGECELPSEEKLLHSARLNVDGQLVLAFENKNFFENAAVDVQIDAPLGGSCRRISDVRGGRSLSNEYEPEAEDPAAFLEKLPSKQINEGDAAAAAAAAGARAGGGDNRPVQDYLEIGGLPFHGPGVLIRRTVRVLLRSISLPSLCCLLRVAAALVGGLRCSRAWRCVRACLLARLQVSAWDIRGVRIPTADFGFLFRRL
eukprot:SAG22_NODE_2354_length_2674_cov_1.317282_1_plen_238_part_10